MGVLETTHKRKSAVITFLILLLLLFCIFNFGMKYQDPPIEYGVAINFGNSDVGNGEPIEDTKTEEIIEEQVEEVVQESLEEVVEDSKTESLEEDVLTDNTVAEAPVVEKIKENKVEVPKEIVEKKEPKIVEKIKPKPSKATSDALNALLGNSNNGGSKGEGDDEESGVKGNENGSPNSNKYYGNTSSGSGGNYNLAGRKALSKPIRKPNCEEEGTVVVIVYVDNNGTVIKADPGEKGSTNTAPCLLKAAKEAALQTKWNPDVNAPKKQKGAIIYKFSLSQ